MILAIDIGNTNIVIGCIEAEKICHELRLATDLVKTSDQYWMDLKGVLALYDLQADEIEGVIISSVVPPVLNSLRTAVMKLTGRTPMVVGPGLKTGLNIAGGNAGQVGSDLVVAAVAALRDYPAPVIIIDMGTATTMMAIDQTGTVLGGSICPGVKVSSEVLTTRTSQLPGISLEAPKHVIGRNTIECMQSGIMLGAACMIDNVNVEAVIVIGCVIRGGTPHFDYVCDSVTQGVAQLNANGEVPVVFGVLTTDNEEQALDRAGGALGNKGAEAAEVAIKMADFTRRMRQE